MNVSGAMQELLDTVARYGLRGASSSKEKPSTSRIAKQFIGAYTLNGKLNHFCASAVAQYIVAPESVIVTSRDALQVIHCEGWGLSSSPSVSAPHSGEICGIVATQNTCTAGYNGGIIIYSPKLRLLKGYTYNGHANSVLSITATPDGKYVATGNANMTVNVWSLPDGELLHSLSAHTDWVRHVKFSKSKGRSLHLYSAGDDGMIALWEAVSGTLIGRLDYSRGQSIQVFEVSWRTGIMAIACDSPAICLYKVVSSETADTATSTLALPPNASGLLGGANSAEAPQHAPRLGTAEGVGPNIREGFSPNGTFRVERVGSDIVAHKCTPTTAKFTDDCQWIVTAGEDEMLAVTSIREPRQMYACDVFMVKRYCVSFMNTVTSLCLLASPPTSSVIIIGACASDGTVVVWVVDPRDGRCSYSKKKQLHIGALIGMDRITYAP